MKLFLEKLKSELNKYSILNDEIQKLKFNNTNEYLTINYNKGYVEYYKCFKNSYTNTVERKYIPKCDITIAENLANKAFYNKIGKIIQKRKILLFRLINNYEDLDLDKYYYSLSKERRNLIKLIVPTWNQKLIKWKSMEYPPLSYPFGDLEIYTKKGERVRSKSEKIFADLLTDFGIEYKYECPLYLENEEVMYPDFTIMPQNSDEVIYWEHFGMMDDSEYVNRVIKKLETYTRNGIYYGKNLFFTFETSKTTFDIKNVEKIIKKFLL